MLQQMEQWKNVERETFE